MKETAGEVADLLKDAGEISDALFFPGTPKRDDSETILVPFILPADAEGRHPQYITSGQAYTLSGSLPEGYGSVTEFLAWFYEQSPLYRVEACSGEAVVVSFLPSSLEGSPMAGYQRKEVYQGIFSITAGEKTLTIDLPAQ